jgi:hypothetical protein
MQVQRLSTCPRCFHALELLVPWRGFQYVRRVWIAGVVVIVVLAPILASDLIVMMPLSVVYLFAGGPVLGFAQLQPTCRVCGLALPARGLPLRVCRPMQLARAPKELRSCAAPEPAPEPEETSGVRPVPRRPG